MLLMDQVGTENLRDGEVVAGLEWIRGLGYEQGWG